MFVMYYGTLNFSESTVHSQSAGQPQFSDQNDVCQQYSSSEGQKRSSVTQRRLKASQIVLYLKC